MTMSPDIVCRMSTEQINRALDNITREREALLADQIVLMKERHRRKDAMGPIRLEGEGWPK
jgi:hypothetical protein